MQKNAKYLEQKLFTIGGVLVLHKFFWYLISWKWQEDGSERTEIGKESKSGIYLMKGYKREATNKKNEEGREKVKKNSGSSPKPQSGYEGRNHI